MTEAGISLRAACFNNDVYEDDAAADCLSNLIAIGFKRFVLDLYWDQEKALWSLCPVAIPSVLPPTNVPSATTIDGSSALQSLSSSSRQNSSRSSTVSTTSSASLAARQATISEARTPLPTLSSGGIFGNTLSYTAVVPESPESPVIKVGPYSCSTTLQFSSITSLILNYIRKTETTFDARLLYLIINIHAASTFDAPTAPAPQPSRLPSSSQYISGVLGSELSNYVYKAAQLGNERPNLNGSWYMTNSRYRPVEDYYNTSTSANNIVSTTDGWPSESYMEFQRSHRVLLGWGNVEPQMSAYNFSGDADVVFDNGYIADTQRDVASNQAGSITEGCFFRTGLPNVAQVNNSWAVSYGIPNFQYPTSTNSGV